MNVLQIKCEIVLQMVGFYVYIGFVLQVVGFDIFENNFGLVFVNEQMKGECICIEGCVFDGIGMVLKDVLIEIWQVNVEGCYDYLVDWQLGKVIDLNFCGWGCVCIDFEIGVYVFEMIKFGVVVGCNGCFMVLYINVWIVVCGINFGLNMCIYFSDEVEVNRNDVVLNLIEWEVCCVMLVVQCEMVDGCIVYCFDICIQGDNEIVFFDI